MVSGASPVFCSTTGTTLSAAAVPAATDGNARRSAEHGAHGAAVDAAHVGEAVVGVVGVTAVMLVVVVLHAARRGGEDRVEVQPVIGRAVRGHREAVRARAGVRQAGSPVWPQASGVDGMFDRAFGGAMLAPSLMWSRRTLVGNWLISAATAVPVTSS